MKKYLLIKPDEDGNPITFLDDNELADLLDNAEDEGIDRFLSDYEDPNYMTDGSAILFEVKVLVPKPTTTKFRL